MSEQKSKFSEIVHEIIYETIVLELSKANTEGKHDLAKALVKLEHKIQLAQTAIKKEMVE